MADSRVQVSTPPAALPDMPINPEWILKGNPVAKGTILIQSEDKKMSSGVWECSPGEFSWIFVWDEFARLSEGEVKIEEEGGKVHHLKARDLVHFAVGMKTRWQVIRTVRKTFVLRTAEAFVL